MYGEKEDSLADFDIREFAEQIRRSERPEHHFVDPDHRATCLHCQVVADTTEVHLVDGIAQMIPF